MFFCFTVANDIAFYKPNSDECLLPLHLILCAFGALQMVVRFVMDRTQCLVIEVFVLALLVLLSVVAGVALCKSWICWFRQQKKNRALRKQKTEAKNACIHRSPNPPCSSKQPKQKTKNRFRCEEPQATTTFTIPFHGLIQRTSNHTLQTACIPSLPLINKKAPQAPIPRLKSHASCASPALWHHLTHAYPVQGRPPPPPHELTHQHP